MNAGLWSVDSRLVAFSRLGMTKDQNAVGLGCFDKKSLGLVDKFRGASGEGDRLADLF